MAIFPEKHKKLPDETVVTRTAYEVSASKIDVVDDSVLPSASGIQMGEFFPTRMIVAEKLCQ